MKCFSSLVLLGLIALALSAGIDNEWKKIDDVNTEDYEIRFRIGLKPQNLETMERLFWEVSDPKSPFYGQFLTNDQIANLISLPREDIQKVLDHVMAHSGEFCEVKAESSIHREYIDVTTCAGQAKYIFPNVNMAVFEGPRGAKIVRSEIEMDIAHNAHFLGLPHELHQYVDTIQNVTDFPLPLKNPKIIKEAYEPNAELIDVEFMTKFFNIDYSVLEDSTINADEGQVRLGVIELESLAFSAKDLATFQKRYNIPNNPIRKVIGVQTVQDGEPALDVQLLTGIGLNMQVWDFVFDHSDFIFTVVVDKIMATPGAPMVYSLSYEAPENYVGESRITVSNTAFMKFGLAGYTFITGSGDAGAGLSYKDCSIFDAYFPATSPYVTSAGGTSINKNTGVEQAWMHSSGGFSTIFKRPSYQDKQVEAYLKQDEGLPVNTEGKMYNTSNRAYPDVAAFGAHSLFCFEGKFIDLAGTSLASPQFTALIGMVNAYRYQNKLGPLGHINPALYGMEGGIGEDVTHGMSYATSRIACWNDYLPGFQAVKGWDGVTGLGSPDFATLISGLGHLGAEKTSSSNENVEDLIKSEFLPLN